MLLGEDTWDWTQLVMGRFGLDMVGWSRDFRLFMLGGSYTVSQFLEGVEGSELTPDHAWMK